MLCLQWWLPIVAHCSWSRVPEYGIPKPSARSVHAAVFDAATNQFWIYGGSSVQFLSDLWSFDFDTGTWDRKQQLNGAPSARGDHVAVWDPDGYALWVHGGYDGTNYFDDLWRYAGYTWTNLATPGPSPRSQHVAVWDATNLAIWIHGGTYGCTLNQDLWKFDTQMGTWSRMPDGNNGSKPSARANHVAAWDEANLALWIHAGYAQSSCNGDLRGGLQQDLWRYDTTANDWDLIAIGGPSARAYHVAGWDPTHRSIWVHGGFDGAVFCRDLWRFDLENYRWNLIALTAGPSARFSHAAVWDFAHTSFCVHGGYSDGRLQNDLWCYVVTTTTTSQTKSSTTTRSITTSKTITSTTTSTATFSTSITSSSITFTTSSSTSTFSKTSSSTVSTSSTSSSSSKSSSITISITTSTSVTSTSSTSTGSSTSSITMSTTTTGSSTQTTTSHTTTTTSTSSTTVSSTTTTSSSSTTSGTTSSTSSTSSTTVSTSITTSSTVTTTSSTFSTSTTSSTSISTTTTTSHTRTTSSTSTTTMSSTSTTLSATTTSSLSTTSSTTSSSSITVTSSSSISSTRTTSTSFTFTTSSITRSLTSTTSATLTSTSRTLSSSTSSTKTSSSSTRTTSSQTKTSSTSSTATMTTSTSSTITTTTTAGEDLTAVYILCPLAGVAIIITITWLLWWYLRYLRLKRAIIVPEPPPKFVVYEAPTMPAPFPLELPPVAPDYPPPEPPWPPPQLMNLQMLQHPTALPLPCPPHPGRAPQQPVPLPDLVKPCYPHMCINISPARKSVFLEPYSPSSEACQADRVYLRKVRDMRVASPSLQRLREPLPTQEVEQLPLQTLGGYPERAPFQPEPLPEPTTQDRMDSACTVVAPVLGDPPSLNLEWCDDGPKPSLTCNEDRMRPQIDRESMGPQLEKVHLIASHCQVVTEAPSLLRGHGEACTQAPRRWLQDVQLAPILNTPAQNPSLRCSSQPRSEDVTSRSRSRFARSASRQRWQNPNARNWQDRRDRRPGPGFYNTDPDPNQFGWIPGRQPAFPSERRRYS